MNLHKQLKSSTCAIFTLAIALPTAVLAAGPDDMTMIYPTDFGNPVSYTAAEMIQNCGGEYADASGKIWVTDVPGGTNVKVQIDDVVPSTFFTVWLKLDGGSDLTGAGVTALADTDEIAELGAATPAVVLKQPALDAGIVGDAGQGTTDQVNGFWSNHNGKAVANFSVDFPVSKGAYQFQEFDSALTRKAVGTAPFTLRVVSHCVDQVGHGLVPGKHEMWFNWSF